MALYVWVLFIAQDVKLSFVSLLASLGTQHHCDKAENDGDCSHLQAQEMLVAATAARSDMDSKKPIDIILPDIYGALEKPLRLEVQEIAPSRNSKSDSTKLSFFYFLIQEHPYPESSELQKELLPIIPEAGSNYQPLINRHGDAEVVSSYRHMGMSLKFATNFSGMVHMPEVQLVYSFLPEDWS